MSSANVKNNEIAVNPLGLTIVRFRGRPGIQLRRETRTSRDLTMSISAANSAGLPYASLCPCEWTNGSFVSHYVSHHYRRSFRGDASSSRTAICLDFREPSADENFALKRVCRFVSRLMLGHRFGAIPAPGGTRSSASHCAPLRGHGSSQNKFAKHSKERPANFFRVPPRKQTFGTWEPGPLASFAPRDPSNNGRIQQTETLSCIRTK